MKLHVGFARIAYTFPQLYEVAKGTPQAGFSRWCTKLTQHNYLRTHFSLPSFISEKLQSLLSKNSSQDTRSEFKSLLVAVHGPQQTFIYRSRFQLPMEHQYYSTKIGCMQGWRNKFPPLPKSSSLYYALQEKKYSLCCCFLKWWGGVGRSAHLLLSVPCWKRTLCFNLIFFAVFLRHREPKVTHTN